MTTSLPRVLGRIVRVLVACALVLPPNATLAQGNLSPVEALRQRTEAQILDLRARTDQVRELLERMIALQEEARVQRAYAGPDGQARARQDAQQTAKELSAAQRTVQGLTDVIGQENRAFVEACVNGVRAASDRLSQQGSAPQAAVPLNVAALGCDEARARAVSEELQRLRRQALEQWGRCRETLILSGRVGAGQLPEDPSGLTDAGREDTQAAIADLRRAPASGQPPAAVRDCLATLEQSWDTIRQTENAQAAMGTALSMAAQICFASGGNPYVCGAMLVLALLMNMGGGGSGKGSGDGGQTRGTGTAQAPGQGQGRPGLGPVVSDVPSRGPAGGSTLPPTNFGSTLQGGVQCSVQSGILTCWRGSEPNRRVTIDPNAGVAEAGGAENWRAVAANVIGTPGQADRLVLCASASPDIPFGSMALFWMNGAQRMKTRVQLDPSARGATAERPTLRFGDERVWGGNPQQQDNWPLARPEDFTAACAS